MKQTDELNTGEVHFLDNRCGFPMTVITWWFFFLIKESI